MSTTEQVDTQIDTQTAIEKIANDIGEVTDWQTMTIVNRGPDPFTIEYAMQKYIVPANGSLDRGHYAVVPYHAFVLYCGDPRSFDVPGDDRQKYRSDEWKRLRCRYGVYDDMANLSNIPPLEAYTIHGDRVLTVLEDPEGVNSFPGAPGSRASQVERQNQLLQDQMARLQAQMDNILAQQTQQAPNLVNPQAVDQSTPADKRQAKSKSGQAEEIPADTPTSASQSNVKIG